MLHTIAIALLTALAIANVGHVLWTQRDNYALVWLIWRRFRFSMLGPTCLAFLAVVTAFLLLRKIPGLNYGWMNLFYASGGNVLVEPLTTGSRSDSTWVRLLPVLFILGLTFAMPFIAIIEEKAFREGAIEWPMIVKRSLVFGPVHCIVGVPLAAGLALVLAGLFYGYQYRRAFLANIERGRDLQAAEDEALMASTTYHTLWNTLVCALLLGSATMAALGGLK